MLTSLLAGCLSCPHALAGALTVRGTTDWGTGEQAGASSL